MLFGNLTLAEILSRAVALLVAITIHECAHAWAASRLGVGALVYGDRNQQGDGTRENLS